MLITLSHTVSYKFNFFKLNIPMKKFSTLILSFFAFVYFAQAQSFLGDITSQTTCEGGQVVYSGFWFGDGATTVESFTWTFDGTTIREDGTATIDGNLITFDLTPDPGSFSSTGNTVVTLAVFDLGTANACTSCVLATASSTDTPTAHATVGSASSNVNLTVNAAPTVTGQPSDVSACDAVAGTMISVTASESVSIQWQRDEGSGFSDLSDAGAMSNTSGTGTTLALTFTTGSDSNTDGDDYRAVITKVGCPNVISNTAELTVLASLADNNNLATGNVPINSSASFFETFTGTSSATKFQWTVNGTTTTEITGIQAGVTDDNIAVGGTHTLDAATETVALGPTTTQAKITLTDDMNGSTQSFTLLVTATGPCPMASSTSTSSTTITALPIELLYFEGRASDSDIQLEWATGTERNNDYFTIERSFDGESFMSVGEVKGVGNSFSESTYKFVDGSVNPAESNGAVYYRLKQTDFDGGFAYVDLISVELKGNAVFDIKGVVLQGNSLTVDYSSPSTLDVTATVYDLNGRLLNSFTAHPSVGFNNEIIDLSNLKPGFYILSMENGNQQASKKFVKF